MCTPGERRCNGDVPQRCDAAGSGWISDAACSGTNVECDPIDGVNACLGPLLDFGDCTAGGDRWIDRTDSSFNVQGYVPAVTSVGSTATVTSCGETLWFSGTAAQVLEDDFGDPDYGTYWGAEMQLRLCEEGADDDNPAARHPIRSCPLPGDQAKVTGVRFKFCGDQANYPPEIRVGFTEATGSTGYIAIEDPMSGAVHTVLMSDTRVWWEDGAPRTDPNDVTGIAWTIPSSDTEAPTPFSFCVTDIEILGSL